MRGMKVQLHTFLISTLNGGEWCTPLPLYPRKRTPGALWIRDWVVPKVGLGVVTKRKIHASVGNKTSVVQRVA
jgi:hypothetical protein